MNSKLNNSRKKNQTEIQNEETKIKIKKRVNNHTEAADQEGAESQKCTNRDQVKTKIERKMDLRRNKERREE